MEDSTMNEVLKKQHAELHALYVAQVELWKREWLKQNPSMELVHYLNDPIGNTARRQKEWDGYIIPLASAWWEERGWLITFGERGEGCNFKPLSFAQIIEA